MDQEDVHCFIRWWLWTPRCFLLEITHLFGSVWQLVFERVMTRWYGFFHLCRSATIFIVRAVALQLLRNIYFVKVGLLVIILMHLSIRILYLYGSALSKVIHLYYIQRWHSVGIQHPPRCPRQVYSVTPCSLKCLCGDFLGLLLYRSGLSLSPYSTRRVLYHSRSKHRRACSDTWTETLQVFVLMSNVQCLYHCYFSLEYAIKVQLQYFWGDGWTTLLLRG